MVHLWDTATLTERSSFDQAGYMSPLTFTRDNRTLITGCRDNTLRLWDAATGEPIGQPRLMPWSPERLTFGGDGKVLFVTSVGKGGLQALDLSASGAGAARGNCSAS